MSSLESENAVVKIWLSRRSLTLYCQWSAHIADVIQQANEELERAGDRAAGGSSLKIRVISLAYLGSSMEPFSSLRDVRTTQRQTTITLNALLFIELVIVKGASLGLDFEKHENPTYLSVSRLPVTSTDSDDSEELYGIEREIALSVQVGMRVVTCNRRSVQGFVVGWAEEIIHSKQDAEFARAFASAPLRHDIVGESHLSVDDARQLINDGDVAYLGVRHDMTARGAPVLRFAGAPEAANIHKAFVERLFPEAVGGFEVANTDTGEIIELQDLRSQHGFRTTIPFFLYCHIVQAKGLAAADWTFSSDPYVRISCGRYRSNTPVVWQTLNPSFRKLIGLTMAHPCRTIKFAVFDEDVTSGDDPLGAVIIDISRLSIDVFTDGWYPIQGGKGTLRLQFMLRRMFHAMATLCTPAWRKYADVAEENPVSTRSAESSFEKSEARLVEYTAQQDVFDEMTIASGEEIGSIRKMDRQSWTFETDESITALGQNSAPAIRTLERSEAERGMLEETVDQDIDLAARLNEELDALVHDVESVLESRVPTEAAKRGGLCTSTVEFLFLSILSPVHRYLQGAGETLDLAEDNPAVKMLEVFLPKLGNRDSRMSVGEIRERRETCGQGSTREAAEVSKQGLPPALLADAGVFGMGCESAWLWGTAEHTDASSLCSLSEIQSIVLELKRIAREGLNPHGNTQTHPGHIDVSTCGATFVYPFSKGRYFQTLEMESHETIPGVTSSGTETLCRLRSRVSTRASVLGNSTDEEGILVSVSPSVEIADVSQASSPTMEPPLLLVGAATRTVGDSDQFRCFLSNDGQSEGLEDRRIWNSFRRMDNSLPNNVLYFRVRETLYFIMCKNRFSYLQMWARIRLLSGDRSNQARLNSSGYCVPGARNRALYDLPLSIEGVTSMVRMRIENGRHEILRLGRAERSGKGRQQSGVWADVRLKLDNETATARIQAASLGGEEVVDLTQVDAIGVSDAPGPVAAYQFSLRVKHAALQDAFHQLAVEQSMGAGERQVASISTAKPFLVLQIVLGHNGLEARSDLYKHFELPAPVVLPVQRGFNPFWNHNVSFGLTSDLRENASLLVTAHTKLVSGSRRAQRSVYLGEKCIPMAAFSSTPLKYQERVVEFIRCKRKISLTIHKAEGLLAGDAGGTSDPYVKIRAYDSAGVRVEGIKMQTDAISKTCDPTFEQEFVLDPIHQQVSRSSIGGSSFQAVDTSEPFFGLCEIVGFELTIYDRDTISRDDLLGSCTVPLQSILGGGAFVKKRIPLLFGPNQKVLPKDGKSLGYIEVSARIQVIKNKVVPGLSKKTKGSRSLADSAGSAPETNNNCTRFSFKLVKLQAESTWWPASAVSRNETEKNVAAGAFWEPQFGVSLSHDHLLLDPAMVTQRDTGMQMPLHVRKGKYSQKQEQDNDFNMLSLIRDEHSDASYRTATIEVLENQRFNPFLDWGSSYPGHLLLNDPRKFTSITGKQRIPVRYLEELNPPMGYVWTSDWTLDMPEDVEWSYGFDFWLLHNTFNDGKCTEKSLDTYVRCRRWARQMALQLDFDTDASAIANCEENLLLAAGFLGGGLHHFATLQKTGEIVFRVYENEVRELDTEKWIEAEVRFTNESGEHSLLDLEDIPSIPGFSFTGPWALLHDRVSETQTEECWTYTEVEEQAEDASATSSDIDGSEHRRRAWVRTLRPGSTSVQRQVVRQSSWKKQDKSLISPGQHIDARGTAMILPLERISSVHVLSSTTVYIIAFGGLMTYVPHSEKFRDLAESDFSEDASTHLLIGPVPAMSFANSILGKIGNLTVSSLLVDLRYLRSQMRDGDIDTPFHKSLSYVNYTKSAHPAGGAVPPSLRKKGKFSQGEDGSRLHRGFRLNEKELLFELQQHLSDESAMEMMESALIDRATHTLQMLQYRVELLCEGVRRLQSMALQLASVSRDYDAQDTRYQKVLARSIRRTRHLYWTYQLGLYHLGVRIRRLTAFALELMSLEIRVPWIEELLLNSLPPEVDETLERAVNMASNGSREHRKSSLQRKVFLASRENNQFLNFRPLAKESGRESTMRALLQSSRITFSMQRMKYDFESDLNRRPTDAAIELHARGGLLDVDELSNNVIISVIVKRGLAFTIRETLSHDISTPNPNIGITRVEDVPKDAHDVLEKALSYVFPLRTSGGGTQDISCSFSGTRQTYLERTIMQKLQAFNKTDTRLKDSEGYAGVNFVRLCILEPSDETQRKSMDSHPVFDLANAESSRSLFPKMTAQVMEQEVLGLLSLNSLETRVECLDFARYLMDDSRKRLTQLSLYWSTMTPDFVAPLVSHIIESFMLGVSSVLSTFVYNDAFEPLNYGSLSAFMKFINFEFTTAEKVLSQSFTVHPGVWGIVPKPSYESCLDLFQVTSWYQKCLLDCMLSLQEAVLQQAVDREVEKNRVEGESSYYAGIESPDIGALSAGSPSWKLMLDKARERGLTKAQVDVLKLLLQTAKAASLPFPGSLPQPMKDNKPVPWRWEILCAPPAPGKERGEWRSETPENLEFALNTYHELVQSIFGKDENMIAAILESHAQTAAALARAWSNGVAQTPLKARGSVAFFSAIANDCLRYITHLDERCEYLPNESSPVYEKALDAIAGTNELFLRVAKKCVTRIAMHVYVDVELYAAENGMAYTQDWALGGDSGSPMVRGRSTDDVSLLTLFLGTLEEYFLEDLTGGFIHERFAERIFRVLLDTLCKRYLLDVRFFCENNGVLGRFGKSALGTFSIDSSWSANLNRTVETRLKEDVERLESFVDNVASLGIRTPPEAFKPFLQPLRKLLNVLTCPENEMVSQAMEMIAKTEGSIDSVGRFMFYSMALRSDVQMVCVHIVQRALINSAKGESDLGKGTLGNRPVGSVEEFMRPVLEHATDEEYNDIIPKDLPETGLPLLALDNTVVPSIQSVFGSAFLDYAAHRREFSKIKRKAHHSHEASEGSVLVTVMVHSATGLQKRSSGFLGSGKASPYVQLSMSSPQGVLYLRTKTKHSDFPVYEQAFTYNLLSVVGARLTVKVIDDRTFSKDRLMGEGECQLSTLRIAEHGEGLRPDRFDVALEPSGLVSVTLSARRAAAPQTAGSENKEHH